MTHTVKESLRWFGVIMIYGRLRKNTYGASFSLPKESDKVGAYKVRRNWRVFWKTHAYRIRRQIDEHMNFIASWRSYSFTERFRIESPHSRKPRGNYMQRMNIGERELE